MAPINTPLLRIVINKFTEMSSHGFQRIVACGGENLIGNLQVTESLRGRASCEGDDVLNIFGRTEPVEEHLQKMFHFLSGALYDYCDM